MKNRMNYLLIVVIPWVLISCIPDPLPVNDIAKPATKIVVSSQLVPNFGLVVLVTKSIGALEAGRGSDPQVLLQQIVIIDATVTLLHVGRTETLRNTGNGLYVSVNSDWAENIAYELHVKTSLYGEVVATTQVPQQVRFTSASVEFYSPGVDSILQVNYGLNDPVGKNFYMISVQKYSRKQDATSLLNPRIFTHLTDDTAFEGQHFEDNFKTLFQRFSKGDSVAVVMSNVNEDYYKFLKLRNDRFRFSEFASEPFNYPTNVQGGYGYFNLHLQDVRVFVLE